MFIKSKELKKVQDQDGYEVYTDDLKNMYIIKDERVKELEYDKVIKYLDDKRLSEFFKKFREINGVKQSEVSYYANINPSNISLAESGYCIPSLKLIISLCECCKVTVDFFLTQYIEYIKMTRKEGEEEVKSKDIEISDLI